jgi:hypothetical protein
MVDVNYESKQLIDDVQRLIDRAWRQVDRSTSEDSRNTWLSFARRLEALRDQLRATRTIVELAGVPG